MPTLVLALIIAAGFAGLAVVLYIAVQKAMLGVADRNEQQRQQNKNEMEGGMREMLDNNRQKFEDAVGELRNQLKDSQHEVRALHQQNSAIREQLVQTAKVTESLHVSTESLRNLLSNNRLRGDWGEQVAEDLLLAAGFVLGTNYIKQKTTVQGRPDFTILLPDGTKLNVDAKFPFDDLIAYQEAKSENEKKKALAAFEQAVKEKIKAITSKDYIDPENQTLDFVVMFIPNEMIFSFIYEKLPRLNEYANERRVVLTGPFGFTALVRLVLQAYKNFKYEKDLQNILGLIGKFQAEYERFGDTMDRLGRQLETTQKTYLEVEGTRSRQLTRIVDKITEHSSSSLPEAEEQALLGIGVEEE